MEAAAKDQHYIPKFYLKGFTDREGVLWVCERFKPPRASKPKLEANRADYYTHSEHGNRDETAEEVLKQVESRVAPIIRKLANPQYVLTPENASHLILFVSFMFARVPSWRENLDKMSADLAKAYQLKVANDRDRFHRLCADYEKSVGKKLGVDFEELRQLVLQEKFEYIQSSKAYNLGAMFNSAFDVLEQLNQFGYQCLYAPEGSYYFTSDSPVFTVRPDGKGEAYIGMGFGLPNVEVYFPLNKRVCLRMRRGILPARKTAEVGRFAQINRLVMITATKHLYSSQSYRRIGRLFDECGCKVKPGANAFMLYPPVKSLKL